MQNICLTIAICIVTQQTQHNKKLTKPTLNICNDPLTCTANAQLPTCAIIPASTPSSYNDIPTLIITTEPESVNLSTYSTPTHIGAGNHEQFLPAGATFSPGSASESHWLQPVLVLTVHWWAAPVCVGGLLDKFQGLLST